MLRRMLISFLLLPLGYTMAFSQIPIIEFDELKDRIESPSDKTVIYNFWATWCAPCVKELPEFEAIHETGKEQNREVVLVSLDFLEHYDKKLIPFVRDKQLKSEVVLLDAPNYNDWIPKIDANWSGTIPATLIVNHKNNVRLFIEKKFNEGELEQLLNNNDL